MTTPRQLIDWHTHGYLPEHVDAAARAAMQARGVMGGEASPEHHQRSVAGGGAEKFVVIRMPTRTQAQIPLVVDGEDEAMAGADAPATAA